MKKILILLAIITSLVSCGDKKPTFTIKDYRETVKRFETDTALQTIVIERNDKMFILERNRMAPEEIVYVKGETARNIFAGVIITLATLLFIYLIALVLDL